MVVANGLELQPHGNGPLIPEMFSLVPRPFRKRIDLRMSGGEGQRKEGSGE